MMKKEQSYKWYDNIGKFPDYTCTDKEGLKRISWFIPLPSLGTPLSSIDEWIAPTLELTKTSILNTPDCINSAVIEFVSESAVSILNDLFTDSRVRLYPVKVMGVFEMYYMVVPALYEEGVNMDVFSLEGEPPYKKYVTQKFIDKVEKNGLTGFCFQSAEGDAFYVNENLVTKRKDKQLEKVVPTSVSIDWLKKVEEFTNQKNWHALDELNHQIMQNLLDANDTDIMMSFYDEALKSLVNEEQYQKIKPADMSRFNQKLADAFEQAYKQSKSDKNVKSIYCEYFYDGGDSCELNLFLCEKSPDEDESWATEFGKDGFIEGPSVNDFLNYDSDFSFEPTLEVVAKQYVQAHFIRSCLNIIKEKNIKEWPIGFAEHDGVIVMLKS